ncbi:MAG: hypothetical protein KC464_34655 [Myxococcales bacterium]|nr:hypothetical protein [Myxococcales bacterium]
MDRVIAEFIATITTLAREAAMQSLSQALGDAGANTLRRKGPAAARKGAKRPASEIDETKQRVATFIAQNPGLRIEQINAQLGTTTKELALPLRKLIAERKVTTKGAKRATVYFAGGGGGGGGAKKRAR